MADGGWYAQQIEKETVAMLRSFYGDRTMRRAREADRPRSMTDSHLGPWFTPNLYDPWPTKHFHSSDLVRGCMMHSVGRRGAPPPQPSKLSASSSESSLSRHRHERRQ